MPEADVSLSVSARDAGFKATLDSLSRESRALEKDLVRMNAAFAKSGTGWDDLTRTEARYKSVRGEIARVRAEQRKLATGAKATGAAFTHMGGRINRALGALNNPLLLAGGGIALAMFAKKAITAASDVTESLNKTKVIFGEAADAVASFASTAADRFGQSTAQALTAAGNFAALGKAAKLTGSELSDFAIRLTSLASDMASFNNTTTDEAIIALSAAMRGEYEPIRRFNVLLDAASLSQAAYAQGLTKTTQKVLPPGIKVQAAYAAILQQTTDQQGDFNRTQDEYANLSRRVSAEWTNLQAAIGESFMPVAKTALSVLKGLFGMISNLGDGLRGTVVTVLALGAAVILLLPRMQALWQAFMAMKTAAAAAAAASGATGFAGSLAAVVSSVNPVVIAIGILAIAMLGIAKGQADAQAAAEEFSATLDEITGKATEASYALAATRLTADVSQEDWKRLEGYGITLAEVTAAAVLGGDHITALEGKFADINEQMNASPGLGNIPLNLAIMGVRSSLRNTNREVRTSEQAWRDQQVATAAATGALDDYAGHTRTAAEYQAELSAAMESTLEVMKDISALMSLRGAEDQFGDAMQTWRKNIRKAWKEAGAGAITEGDAQFRAVRQSMDTGFAKGQTLVEQLLKKGDVDGALKVVQTLTAKAKKNIADLPMDPATRANLLEPAQALLDLVLQAKAAANSIGPPPVPTYIPWTGPAASPSTAGTPSPGDTTAPWGIGPAGSALAFHATADAARTRIVSGFRNHSLGSPGSDHLTGRAIDLAGGNLPSYARMVKSAGGYAAFHGTGGQRHLHAVPATRAAAARQPDAVAAGPVIGTVVVNHPAHGIDVERAVARAIARADRIRRERG